jgi:hypothetical protein
MFPGRLGAVLVALCFTAALAGAEEPARSAGCLPESQFSLGGIGLNDKARSVHAKLGKPGRRTTSQSEDDGGTYTLTREEYDGIVVTLGRDRVVESLVASSPKYPLGRSGVKVGMTAREVRRRLHLPPEGSVPDRQIALGACDSPSEVDLLLTFQTKGGGEGMLVKIAIEVYGP